MVTRFVVKRHLRPVFIPLNHRPNNTRGPILIVVHPWLLRTLIPLLFLNSVKLYLFWSQLFYGQLVLVFIALESFAVHQLEIEAIVLLVSCGNILLVQIWS